MNNSAAVLNRASLEFTSESKACLKTMDDTEISKTLQIPRNLNRFREMVVMHLNKNDIGTSLLQSEF